MAYKSVYKCRLCGCIYRNGGTTGLTIAEASLAEIHVGICGTVPMAPRKTETHHCDDGSLGVADFLGWEMEENKNV